MSDTMQDRASPGDAAQLETASGDREGLPTGEGTAAKNDVADPHPATEEDYDKIPRPGGAKRTEEGDIGPNSYAHNGTAPPRPKNKGSGPK